MSEYSILLVSGLLTLAALVVIAGIVSLFVAPLRSYVREFVLRGRLAGHARRIKALDEYLELNALPEARDLLKDCLFLEENVASKHMAELMLNHNLGVLARTMTLADRLGLSLRALPLVEGLIQSRHELLSALVDLQDDLSLWDGAAARGGSAFRTLQDRRHGIMERLEANRRGLSAQFSEMLGELKQTPADASGVIIH